MKFYGEPGLLVRVRNNGPLKRIKPFRFDENGEFETNNRHLIKVLSAKFKSDTEQLTELVEETESVVEIKAYSDEEIRALAKEQKIKSWHVKSIETLKEELGV